MPWVKIDDSFTDHPKARHVGNLGIALFVRGLCYTSRWLLDGFLPAHIVAGWVREMGRSGAQALAKLLEAPPGFMRGLWESAEGGYRIHDYLDYSPSKQDVMAERQAARERKERWKERRSERQPEQRSERSTERRENGGGNDAHARGPAGAIPSRPVPYPSHTHTPSPTPSPPGPPGAGAGALSGLGTGSPGNSWRRPTSAAVQAAIGRGSPSSRQETRADVKLRELHHRAPVGDRDTPAREFQAWLDRVGNEWANGIPEPGESEPEKGVQDG